MGTSHLAEKIKIATAPREPVESSIISSMLLVADESGGLASRTDLQDEWERNANRQYTLSVS